MQDHRIERVDDDEAHERAVEHLVALMGAECAEEIRWDPRYHLQGHVERGGQHLVVIAARDAEHEPRVMSESDWRELRYGCLSVA
ncbi:hypothetical protein [Ilumatobacter sp.]|uniref:hypothetical protein n=1 Tax=Ilumatobacter sp. TaxID=1967498 RepID=UPI003B518806